MTSLPTVQSVHRTKVEVGFQLRRYAMWRSQCVQSCGFALEAPAFGHTTQSFNINESTIYISTQTISPHSSAHNQILCNPDALGLNVFRRLEPMSQSAIHDKHVQSCAMVPSNLTQNGGTASSPLWQQIIDGRLQEIAWGRRLAQIPLSAESAAVSCGIGSSLRKH